MTTSSPTSSIDGLAARVPGLEVGAEAGGLEFADVHREGRYRAGEAVAHVRAAADRGDPQVRRATSSCSQRKPSGGSGRAGGGDAPHRGEVEVARRVDAGLAAGHDVGGRGAEEGGPGPFGDPPLGARVRVAGAAVVEDDVVPVSRPDTRKFHIIQPVEVYQKKRSLGPQVAVQAELLEVLDEDAALGLDDGLGEAGGARGVEHPQRVVEGHLLEDGFHVGGGQGRPLSA